MIRKSILAAALALPFGVFAQQTQYISDVITVPVRSEASSDASLVGTISSGAQVRVLRNLGPESYSQVRTTDGVTGWIPTRYLSDTPAAKDRLDELQQQLTQARERIAQLESELASSQERLTEARPAFELAAENEQLRSAVAAAESNAVAMQRQYDSERARRRTLLAGAALVGFGVILGLLLPWLGRGRRRRYSDL